MKKRLITSCLIMLVVVIGLAGYKLKADASSNNDSKTGENAKIYCELGERLKEIEENKNMDEVVLEINDKEIKFDRLARYSAYQASFTKNVNLEGIKKDMTTKVVLYEEAERLGLMPTNEEVIKYIDNVKKDLTQSANREEINCLIENLGMTTDEFLYEYDYDSYEYSIINERLSRHLEKSYPQNEGEDNKQYFKRVSKEWDKYITNLVKDAKVEIVNKQLWNNLKEYI